MMNTERVPVAQEYIGDGGWLLQKGIDYAMGRVVFDRPIGHNQGVQFSLPAPLPSSKRLT
jgi:acyl-CoA dehydrogenase